MPRRSTPAVTVFFLKVGSHAVPNQEVVEPAAHQSGITNLQGISGTVVRFFVVHQAGLPVRPYGDGCVPPSLLASTLGTHPMFTEAG